MNFIKLPTGAIIELRHISSIEKKYSLHFVPIKGLFWTYEEPQFYESGSNIVMDSGSEYPIEDKTPIEVCKWLSEQKIFIVIS